MPRFLTVLAALVLIGGVAAIAQTPKPAASSTAPDKAHVARKAARPAPRTADGHADLQGMWDFAQLTPFERPGNFAGRNTVSDEEAEEFAQQRIESTNKDRRDGGAAADVERAYNDFWWDFGTRVSKQSSLVVDPPDGHVPPLTAEAEKRAAERRNRFDNPEERPLPERCILGFNSGPPMVPSAYNNNVQIVQTRDHIVIVNEMIHSARIIDFSRRAHWPKAMRFLTGDSIAHWEGDTLVVDTIGFDPNKGITEIPGGGFRTANSHLVERYRLLKGGALLSVRFTWTDPSVFQTPYTYEFRYRRAEKEYEPRPFERCDPFDKDYAEFHEQK